MWHTFLLIRDSIHLHTNYIFIFFTFLKLNSTFLRANTVEYIRIVQCKFTNRYNHLLIVREFVETLF